MSTIKSSDEHLTLNADGSSKDIKFQANGVEKASISSSGAFTSTSINTGTIEADDKVTISYEAGSSDWELESTSGDDFTISRNSQQRLLIDGSNGNVGIGTLPSYKLHILIGAGEASGVGILNTSGQGLNIYTDSTAANADVSIDQGATGAATIFRQNSTERMRIDSSGNLSIGTYANPPSSSFIRLTSSGIVQSGRTGTGNQPMVEFFNGNGVVGSIYTGGTTTTYYTSSDYRLKENVNYDWDATTRLKQLKPARFNFIADDSVTFDGFLAHEVQDIVPEAIGGEKDAMMDEEYEVTPAVEEVRDEEGNITTEAVAAVMGTRSVPDYQGIDQSKLVPLLVKTIQELEARITALEA
jgi:hypothetical protein